MVDLGRIKMADGQGGFNPFEDKTGLPKKEEVKDEPTADQIALRESQERNAKLEADIQAKDEAHERRLDQFNDFLQGNMDKKIETQDAPPVEVSDADFDKSPGEAWDKKFDSKMRPVLEEVGRHYNTIIGDLTDQVFEAQVEALSKERFYPFLKDKVQDFFNKNPEAKRSKKAAKTIYDQYVGSDIDGLLEKEEQLKQERQEITLDEPRRRVVSPAEGGGGRPPAPRMPVQRQPEENALEESEHALFEIYQRYGAFENEEDWNNWKATVNRGGRQEIRSDLQDRGR